MARLKKLQKVSELNHLGYTIPIMFDPNEKALNFVGEFGGTYYTFPTANEVRLKLIDVINRSAGLQWTPVITCAHTVEYRSGTSSQIDLKLSREYYALRNDGKLINCTWDVPPAERITKSKYGGSFLARAIVQNGEIYLPGHTKNNYTKINYLPYSDELWTWLNWLNDILATVGNRVDYLLENPQNYVNLDLIKHVLHQKVKTDAD